MIAHGYSASESSDRQDVTIADLAYQSLATPQHGAGEGLTFDDERSWLIVLDGKRILDGLRWLARRARTSEEESCKRSPE